MTIDPDEIMSTINRNRTDLGLSFLHAVPIAENGTTQKVLLFLVKQ